MSLLLNLTDLDCQEISGGRNNSIQVIAGRIEGSNIVAANDDSVITMDDTVMVAAGRDVEIGNLLNDSSVEIEVEVEDSFNGSCRSFNNSRRRRGRRRGRC